MMENQSQSKKIDRLKDHYQKKSYLLLEFSLPMPES